MVVAENGQNQMITKGALDNILAVCDQIQLGDKTLPLDGDHLKTIQERLCWLERPGISRFGGGDQTCSPD